MRSVGDRCNCEHFCAAASLLYSLSNICPISLSLIPYAVTVRLVSRHLLPYNGKVLLKLKAMW
jgi:hypothetical protein